MTTPRQHPTIQAPLGPPLGKGEERSRPVGRIGGTSGNPAPSVLADCDGCELDGRPVSTPADWLQVINTGCLADVTGAFALVWSDPDGTLHLARDGVGERTLFYAPTPDGLVFASSIRAILATGLVPRRLNLRAVAAYLCYAYLPGRETLADGVYELLPGEHVSYGPAGLRREPFWELPAPPPDPSPEDEQARRLRHALETAVRRRLPAPDEPVGAFLSGGLDSSLVVALARKLHPAPVLTYSVSFGAGYANELPFSSMVADHCGTDRRIVELSPAAVLHHLDDSVALLSDPIGDPLTVPNALLFREAARHVGIVLNGEGGDPCFGGPKNRPMVLSELYPTPGEGREASYLRAHLKCYDDLPEMLAEPVRDALAAAPLEDELAPQLRDPRWPDFVARLQAVNIRLKGGHHILPKVDALSAPFGVLPRSPLFDRSVVGLSLGIPARLKLRGSVEKYLLKRAVSDLLPAAIIDRPKSGMLVPVEGWFQGPLLPAARERLLDGLTRFGLFRREYLERLLSGRLGGLRPRHGAKVWLLVTLEAWLRRVLEDRSSP
jgi:asparagine synthase (glutamine-hydrolysing)